MRIRFDFAPQAHDQHVNRPVKDFGAFAMGQGQQLLAIEHPAGVLRQRQQQVHVGKRKIKLRPEELQKVTGERGRRGSLMRGLQKIDRVEIDSPRRASSAGDSEE